MRFSDTFSIPEDTDLKVLATEIQQLLRQLGFHTISAGAAEISGVKTAPFAACEFVLSIRLLSQEVRVYATSRPRGLFLGLLPLTGCGLLCGLSCGLACTVSCSCGASALFLGQAASGVRQYARHLFELIAAVIREKARHSGMCPGCGTPLPAEARFCRNCGARIR